METQNSLRTEGIILKVIDFRDYDQILTLFTYDLGVIKLLIKKKTQGDALSPSKLSPFTRAEFVFWPNQGEIWRCKEMTILNYNFKLREKFEWLETAGRLINNTIISQMDHKPAPLIYQLLVSYVEKIPLIKNLRSLETSYMLKILKHEGLININLHCCICQKPLKGLSIARNDHYCSIHAPIHSIFFNEEETLTYMQLTACQSFSELEKIQTSEEFRLKIAHLFEETIRPQ